MDHQVGVSYCTAYETRLNSRWDDGTRSKVLLAIGLEAGRACQRFTSTSRRVLDVTRGREGILRLNTSSLFVY